MRYFELHGRTLIVMLSVTSAIGLIFFMGLWLGRSKSSDEIASLNTAIEECVADVERKCPALFQYAGMLEAENSILNKKLKQCQQRNRQVSR